MPLEGRCPCGNLTVHWQTVDYSVVPRACGCDYCRERGAAWVSKPGTRVRLGARSEGAWRTRRQGSGTAVFHECASCGAVLLVTVEVDGDRFGAVNARHLRNPHGFAASVATDVSGQGVADKLARWRANWCRPVILPPGGARLRAGPSGCPPAAGSR